MKTKKLIKEYIKSFAKASLKRGFIITQLENDALKRRIKSYLKTGYIRKGDLNK